MAAADQIRSLISSYGEDNEHRFFTTAMQIAASEAQQGHTQVAHELKQFIEKARKEKSIAYLDSAKTVPLSAPKREFKKLIEVFKPRITLRDMVLSDTVQHTLDKFIQEQHKWAILRKHNLSPK